MPPLSVSALRIRRWNSRTAVSAGALVAAAVAGVALVAHPAAPPPPAPRPAPVDIPLTRAWPSVRVAAGLAGTLADGTVFTPRLYLDPQTSIGVARAADGQAQRILLRAGDGAVTELRRVPDTHSPTFNGFTASGDTVVWAETVASTGPDQKTSIWRANRRTGAVSVLVADAGSATFRKSSYDLVIASGIVHWITGGNVKHIAAHLLSVPLTGGKVTSRPVPALLSMAGWPWLSTAEAAPSVPATLYRVDTGKRQTVPTTPAETVKCGPSWCLVGVAGATGVTRTDAMRPDGTDRHRIGGPDSSTVMNDVAVAGRFQPLGLSANDGSGTVALQVVDLQRRQTVRIAAGVSVVDVSGTVLWWAVGLPGRPYTWYALDLATV